MCCVALSCKSAQRSAPDRPLAPHAECVGTFLAMGIFGHGMPFDLVGSRWQLLADRHNQYILVGWVDRRLACRDQSSALILHLHAGEPRDHRLVEGDPYLLG